MTILVTRPEPRANRTVAALEARGLTALACPLFTIAPSGAARPGGKFAALLVTSGHGAAGLTPAMADLPENLPVFAVGDRTAEAMTANGFSNVTSASGDQKALTKLVLAKLKPRYRVLLATGEDHKDGLAAAFADAGHEIALWIRYKAEAVPELPEAARAVLAAGSIKMVLHYSRRASETFVALAEKAGIGTSVAALRHLALSADVAEPLLAAGFEQVSVADHPDEDHVLALASAGATVTVPPEPVAVPVQPVAVPSIATRTTPRTRTSSVPAGTVVRSASDTESTVPHQPAPMPEVVSEAAPSPPPSPAAAQTAPPIPSAPPVIRRGIGAGPMIGVSLASGLIGAALAVYLAPMLGSVGVTLPQPPVVTELSSRLAKIEAARPATGSPDMQAAIQSAVQTAMQSGSAQIPPQLRDQISGLERRMAELAARPQGSAASVDNGVITELRAKLAGAEQATQAMAPRLAELEKVARAVGTPSVSATGAAKLIVADRLARALAEGRPFGSEITALTALGAAAEPMKVLTPLAANGAPTMAAITAEFRKLRAVFAAEPASPDAPWSERLLKLTDGLVRVRSTGEVQGSSPAAVATRIDQALQRGDSPAAVAAFADLPEPARRVGDAWIATLRQRASADQAIKTITDDAIKALSVQK